MQLEQALEVSEKDVKDASQGVLKDLKRFQKEKEEDLQRYMVSLCSGSFVSDRNINKIVDCIRQVPH